MQQRVNEIDLLRFIAALAVVFFHYAFRGYVADDLSLLPYPLLASWAKYGYLGVELFFMISGFVILMTATHSNVQHFIISRATRLYPAFWIACTFTFLTTLWLGAPRFTTSFSEYVGNLSLLGEFLGITAMDGSYWSLFIELRFYLLVFLLLLIGKLKYAQMLLVAWLTVSFFLEIRPISSLRYIFITDYAAFFIAGATSFLIWSESLSLHTGLLLLSAWALSEYETLHLLPSMEEHYKTSFNRFTIIGIITGFFIVVFLIAQRWTGCFTNTHWLRLGALTYPLYLIHQNIGYIIFNKLYASINSHLLFWGTIALMLLVAYGMHVLLEKKMAKKLRNFLELLLAHKSNTYIPNSFNSPKRGRSSSDFKLK